jgi:tetratricopeptide (TPR) repeat protein
MHFPFSGSTCSARLLLLVVALYGTSAQALPIESRTGKPPTSAALPPEAAANIEFRKGIDAGLKRKNNVAKSHFLAALKLDAKFTPAMIGLADIAQKEGDRAQAEKYLIQAESAAPQAAEVHLAWGRFYVSTRQFEKAEFSFKQAINLNPKSVSPLLELGDLYLTMDASRRNDAVKTFATAMELAPDNKFAAYSFGVASALIGRQEDALSAFEKAATLAPKDPAPLRAIGRLYMETGALDRALNAFDRGLKRQPNFLALMLDRGDALASGRGPMRSAICHRLRSRSGIGGGTGRWATPPRQHAGTKRRGRQPSSWMAKCLPTITSPGCWCSRAVRRKKQESAKKAVSLAPNSAPLPGYPGRAQRAADVAGARVAPAPRKSSPATEFSFTRRRPDGTEKDRRSG